MMLAKSGQAGDQAAPSAANPHVSWGLRLGRETTVTHTRLWHWGDNPGFKALLIRDANAGESLVLYTNSESGLSTHVQLLKRFFGEGDYPAETRVDTPAVILRAEGVQ